MGKGHWEKVYEGRSEEVANRMLLSKRALGYKVKITRKRLGIGRWRSTWIWVK